MLPLDIVSIIAVTALVLTILGKWFTKAYADKKIDWTEIPELLDELWTNVQLREQLAKILEAYFEEKKETSK